jgi:hypothetical protein
VDRRDSSSPQDSPIAEEDEEALMTKTLALLRKDTSKFEALDLSDTSHFDEEKERSPESLLKAFNIILLGECYCY